MALAGTNLAVKVAPKKVAPTVEAEVVVEVEVAATSAHRTDNANVSMLKASSWPQTWIQALPRRQPMAPASKMRQEPSRGRIAHLAHLNAVGVVVALSAVVASARPTPSKPQRATGPSRGRTTAMIAGPIAIVIQVKVAEATCRTRERPAQQNVQHHWLWLSRTKTRNQAKVAMTLQCVLMAQRPANDAHGDAIVHPGNVANAANKPIVRNVRFVKFCRFRKLLPKNPGGLTSRPARRSLRQRLLRCKRCQRL